MRTITYTDALELVTKVVTEFGEDYVYRVPWGANSCRYIDRDYEPSCLISHVLVNHLGVSKYWLSMQEGEPASEVAFLLEGERDFHFTPKSREFLDRVQFAQDYGRPWGEALRHGVFDVNISYPEEHFE